MELMTKELEMKFPRLYETGNISIDDRIVIAKFFNPCGAGTWYAIEYDPEEKLFFGYVSIFGDYYNDEYGFFTLEQLESMKLPFGLTIERDLYFKPQPMSSILAQLNYNELY